jgi:very-short-patch-repair endonuclease
MALWRISSNARKLRSSPTNAERILWGALRNRRFAGRKFRRQHPVDRYVVDFICIERKLIVEIDGATHSTAREVSRDAERTKVLESLGFNVIRVTNLDVYKNLEGVLEMIADNLKLS